MKSLLKEKYQFKSEAEISKLGDQIQNGQASLEDSMWKRTIEKMFEQSDCEVLTQKVFTLIEQKRMLQQ
jgi:hypothetical protein